MEELEESVWSVVRQEDEREDLGEGVRDSRKNGTDVYGAETWALQKAQENIGCRRHDNATMRSCETGQDQK